MVVELTGLLRAPGRVVGGVEVQHDALTGKVLQRDLGTVLIDEGKSGGPCADF